MDPRGLLLSDDLIFVSRVTGTAAALGLHMRAVRSAADLLRLADEDRPACVLLDLHNAGLDIAAVVRHLKSEAGPFIVGYGSHVDVATLRAARDAGCDLVLPRSAFVEQLPTALPTWFGGAAS